jgi:hypothetical protein
MADVVMRMPEAPSAPSVTNVFPAATVQRRCAGCEEEEKSSKIQRMESSSSAPQTHDSVSARINALKSGGSPLPSATQAFFESRFGADFSNVRVHTGSEAEGTASAINARAYTSGRHIVFGAGQYAPNSRTGQHLLAHELTHVVQQGAASAEAIAPSSGRTAEDEIMRDVARESTVTICRRSLTSKNFKVSLGGVRVVMLLNPLDVSVKDCRDHAYWVTLTRSREWWPDDELATCEGKTGGTSSFSFGNLPSGTYYITINRSFDHPYCCIDGDILIFDEPVSADSSGCERDEDLTAMDIVHGALDIAGFVPVLGAIPDGVNAAIYMFEGDWTNAGLSAFAAIPGWGDGVKLGVMTEKGVAKITVRASRKALFKTGEEGVAKALKEARAAEKAAAEAAAKAEKEAAQAAAARGEREAAERTEKEAAEKAERDAAERKKKEKEGKGNCATRHPSELSCSMLSARGYFHHSVRAALSSLKLATGTKDLALHNPSITTSGPCPGRGMHYNVRSQGMKVGTIVCCPCCTDTPAGPKMQNLCRVL